MNEMIEKVAKAIANHVHFGGDYGMTGEEAYEDRREDYIAMARAAIEAMRDPSEWMKEAGAAPIRNYSQGQFPFAQTAGHTFRHMIEAALSEEKAE